MCVCTRETQWVGEPESEEGGEREGEGEHSSRAGRRLTGGSGG